MKKISTNFKVLFLISLYSLLISIVSSKARFQKKCLNQHNIFRNRHGVPHLKLNRKLCNTASDWANQLSNTNTFEHNRNNKYGENMYVTTGGNYNGRTAVLAWYNEIKDYDFRKPRFSLETGHFTQVVWKNTREVCCAVAKRGNKTIIVAHYNPPGNYEGQFEKNVLYPKDL